MSLDLMRETFLFGNIDIIDMSFRRVSLETLFSFLKKTDKEVLRTDKSLPWRFLRNFKNLINIYENHLLKEEKKFYEFIDFFEKCVLFYKSLEMKEEEKEYLKINTTYLFDIFLGRLQTYQKNNKRITTDGLVERFQDVIIKDSDLTFDYVSPYENIRWSSKWKLLSKNKEITFDNIDVYLDSYFKNFNIYYNSTMCNSIKSLAERLEFLKKNSPIYFDILNKDIESVSGAFFNCFPYNIIYNHYPKLFPFKCYRPPLSLNRFISKERWMFSILPGFLSGYLLGIPVISMDIPENKQLSRIIEIFEQKGEEKYFEYIRDRFNHKYIESVSFDTETGNGKDGDKIVDLCFSDIREYNQDDVVGVFNNNVIHYFTSKEFKSIIKNQENPYNRQNFPNLNKLIENLKFKNKVRRNLINKGLDVELEGTLTENFEEIIKKISSENVVHYFPHTENNTDVFYRPLFEMLLNSL